MAEDLKPLLDAMRQENALAHAETRRHGETIAVETRRHSETIATETRRHFEVVAERIEKKVEAVAEAVIHLDQKLERETADIRAEMRSGFAETQA